ncbi:MAG: ArsR/SmtB family transcription factor [Desulfonatronovibrionaceae bacterium]
MREFIKVMKALSDRTRVKIVKILQQRELCVCEIQKALGIAQSTASKHLKILEEAGLATYTKDGLWVNYSLADGAKNPYAADMLEKCRSWLEDDPEVMELMLRLPEIRREDICRSRSCSSEKELGLNP